MISFATPIAGNCGEPVSGIDKAKVFSEAKRLHDAGWAIHWLMPREKRPAKAGWTTGPRESWPELKNSYPFGGNVGVRLGSASRLNGGFLLACIDCDVKGTEAFFADEMRARLSEIFPGHESAPSVESGRGNGSRHIYVATRGAERGRVLAQSSEETRVKMPSVKPSRREMETMSADEIKAGYRLRPAWEISLMTEGRQMVLPPSIHPDTGAAYRWVVPFTGMVPELALNKGAETGRAIGGLAAGAAGRLGGSGDFLSFKWSPVPVSLKDDPRSNEKLRALCEDAEGFDDHSKALFSACLKLNASGFGRDEILTVLTDPSTALGACPYRHCKRPVLEQHRRRAAFWLSRYTLARALELGGLEAEYGGEVVRGEPLDDDQAEAQKSDLVGAADWRMGLERGGQNGTGKPKGTLANVILVLENEVGPGVFKKNLFTGYEIHGRATPWGARAGDEIDDGHLIAVKVWFANHFGFEPPTGLVSEAVSDIARRNSFHPVREYLDRLEWDGVPRIDSWLARYCGAQAEEPYLSAISRKSLVAMIARVMNPGAKFDCVLILEGSQGIGKSTLIRFLAGDEWFTDAHIDIKNKDAVLSIGGVWAVELGELSSLRKADVDQLKEFMSRTVDRIRVPYGERPIKIPRQCVFFGTTNSDEYLRDMTGNRRFWPVSVGDCKFDEIKRDRDQLFAEARWFYDLGEPLYLADKEALKGAKAEQEKRETYDALQERLADFFDHAASVENFPFDLSCFHMADLFGDHGPMAGTRMDKGEQMRVGGLLRKMGFRKALKRTKRGVANWWTRTEK
jgi:predicted P-loop ATPase